MQSQTDADVDIAVTALERAKETHKDVVIVSEDVDVLCILLHNAISVEDSSNVFMRRSLANH